MKDLLIYLALIILLGLALYDYSRVTGNFNGPMGLFLLCALIGAFIVRPWRSQPREKKERRR